LLLQVRRSAGPLMREASIGYGQALATRWRSLHNAAIPPAWTQEGKSANFAPGST